MQTYRHTDIDMQAYRHTDMQTYRHTNIDIQAYRHTGIQTYRHTDAPWTYILQFTKLQTSAIFRRNGKITCLKIVSKFSLENENAMR
jgi:hypothetical protein